MYTKKKVTETLTRVVNLIGLSVAFLKDHWLTALLFFLLTIIFFWIAPAIICKIVLKKDEQEEVDGELYLWNNDDRIDYRLSLNAVNEIPYKEYLKIRVNENARDESIMKKK